MTMAARGNVCEKKGAKIARGPPGREACVELRAATALECVRRPASIERINARAHYSPPSNVCVLCPSVSHLNQRSCAPPARRHSSLRLYKPVDPEHLDQMQEITGQMHKKLPKGGCRGHAAQVACTGQLGAATDRSAWLAGENWRENVRRWR